MINETDTFLNTNDFAEAAIFTPDGGKPVKCNVLFNNAGSNQQTGNVTIINDTPTAEIKSLLVPAATIEGTLKIGSVLWYVINIEPEIHGFRNMILSRSPKK